MYKEIDKQVQKKVAEKIAEGEYTDRWVAISCGITPRTLARWRKQPEFQSMLSETIAAQTGRELSEGVPTQRRVIGEWEEQWRAVQLVFDARAQNPKMAGVPGGRTGLLNERIVGYCRRSGRVITDYGVDAASVRLQCKLERQAAELLGQWGQPIPPETVANGLDTPLLDGAMERAALYRALGWSTGSIVGKCHINRHTLEKWARRPEFCLRIRQLKARRLCNLPVIANKAVRLERLGERKYKLMQIIEEQAQAGKNLDLAGGGTGLLHLWFQRVRLGTRTVFLADYRSDSTLIKLVLRYLAQAWGELNKGSTD